MTAHVVALSGGPLFYPGLHQPSDAHRFPRACISIRRLWGRRKPLGCSDVMIDSGAFSELALHGCYRTGVEEYARELRRLHEGGVARITVAVAQDWMCEPWMLAKTGLTVADHQRLTIERYDALLACRPLVPILPVLQGYDPADYVRHVAAYGARLTPGMWVGVGSICKRNGAPERVVEVLAAIKAVRPDLRLHAFGLKLTALAHPGVRELVHSADSMAWSFSARRQGRNGNCWTEAQAFGERIAETAARSPEPWTPPLPFWGAA
jgi:hypothetical protein